MALSITSGSGSVTSQANTQTPQNSVGPSTGAVSSKNVQTGTASQLLANSGTGGVALTAQPLTTVTVNGSTTSTQATPATSPAKHHFNPVLLGIVVVLVVAAVAAAWGINRSAKNTTY